jgi:hypothetical protein
MLAIQSANADTIVYLLPTPSTPHPTPQPRNPAHNAESVGVFNAVVKDLPFRNGYFYDMTTNALNKGQADPCPLHTKMLKKIKAVK